MYYYLVAASRFLYIIDPVRLQIVDQFLPLVHQCRFQYRYINSQVSSILQFINFIEFLMSVNLLCTFLAVSGTEVYMVNILNIKTLFIN